jgi:hypothetical protein
MLKNKRSKNSRSKPLKRSKKIKHIHNRMRYGGANKIDVSKLKTEREGSNIYVLDDDMRLACPIKGNDIKVENLIFVDDYAIDAKNLSDYCISNQLRRVMNYVINIDDKINILHPVTNKPISDIDITNINNFLKIGLQLRKAMPLSRKERQFSLHYLPSFNVDCKGESYELTVPNINLMVDVYSDYGEDDDEETQYSAKLHIYLNMPTKDKKEHILESYNLDSDFQECFINALIDLLNKLELPTVDSETITIEDVESPKENPDKLVIYAGIYDNDLINSFQRAIRDIKNPLITQNQRIEEIFDAMSVTD